MEFTCTPHSSTRAARQEKYCPGHCVWCVTSCVPDTGMLCIMEPTPHRAEFRPMPASDTAACQKWAPLKHSSPPPNSSGTYDVPMPTPGSVSQAPASRPGPPSHAPRRVSTGRWDAGLLDGSTAGQHTSMRAVRLQIGTANTHACKKKAVRRVRSKACRDLWRVRKETRQCEPKGGKRIQPCRCSKVGTASVPRYSDVQRAKARGTQQHNWQNQRSSCASPTCCHAKYAAVMQHCACTHGSKHKQGNISGGKQSRHVAAAHGSALWAEWSHAQVGGRQSGGGCHALVQLLHAPWGKGARERRSQQPKATQRKKP